jgi:hypothetical protein
MKIKILYPFVLLILVSACSTDPKAKAKKSIEAYLQTKLNDPKSYEFMELDSLKPITKSDSLRSAQIDEEYTAIKSFDYDAEKRRLNIIYDYSIPLAETQKLIDKLTEVQTKDSLIKVKYAALITPETDKIVTGYSTVLKFRSKNGMGALTIGNERFTLDKDFKVLDASAVK